MIKSVSIKNIQSHKETNLELSPGINCIIGSSNNGKSVIFRSLNWLINNRPLGVDTLNSHWNYDKKDNLKEPMSVSVINENGKVERRRTKDENQYIVNDKVLNVVKSDVPEEVKNILRLSKTNYQFQMDSPFLLSDTSGEVAKYLNSIVHLDIIDKILSNAESKKRSEKNKIENIKKSIENEENSLKSFDWIPIVEKLISKYENIKASCIEIDEKKNILTSQIKEFENAKKIIDNNNFEKCKKFISKIENIDSMKKETAEKINELKSSISSFESCRIYPSFNKQKEFILCLSDDNFELKNRIKELNNSIFEFEKHKSSINDNSKEIEKLVKQLPDICPICGNKINTCLKEKNHETEKS